MKLKIAEVYTKKLTDIKPLTEGKTRGSKKIYNGKSIRPNRPPPSPNPRPKQEPRIKEIYCLKWKQSGRIPVLEGYIDKQRAQDHADYCNKVVGTSALQKLLGRYWVVETIKIPERMHNGLNWRV